MKRLIVCCDGTWCTPDQEQDGVPIPTNVVRIYNALKDAGDNENQLKYYHPGVGTGGSLLERLSGGSGGSGLGKNIMSAYKWLSSNYESRDRIFLFGFSRGAYTVRSLAGMIAACGLLDLSGLSQRVGWKRVMCAYEDCYQVEPGKRNSKWSKSWKFHEADAGNEELNIFFLGVWDTVGALGIPDNLAILNLFDPDHKHNFHDTKLSDRVIHAFHAVALDEWRASFTPTLWTNVEDRKTVHQVWFPGSHSDVGGGYKETGLSDGALKWMIDAVLSTDDGVAFRDGMIEQIKPDYQGVLHDSFRGFFAALPSFPRPIPLLQKTGSTPQLHKSIQDRLTHPPITQAVYHPTKILEPDESVERSIYALNPWNDTGIYLQKGVRYEFSARGEWLDRNIRCGPDGASDGKFQIAELAHLGGMFLGQLENAYKWVTGNESADFYATRRYEDAPWFCLMGAIANSGNPDEDGTPQPAEIIEIGRACPHSPKKSGYLYCFANDAWNFYDNNRGSVSLNIKRIKDTG